MASNMTMRISTLLFVLTLAPAQQAISEEVIFEDPGKFIMVEGGACGQAGADEIVSLPGSLQIPGDFASGAATVVLNGWRLGYSDGDHKVQSARAYISDQQLTGGTLYWNAVGVVHDDAGFLDLFDQIDDPHEFCYRYIAFAWDRGDIHALVGQPTTGNINNDDDDPERSTTAMASRVFTRENPWSTALVNGSRVHRPRREGGVAILPQGFDVGWGDVGDDVADGVGAFLGVYDGPDNRLLQIAYGRSASANFHNVNVDQFQASRLDVSWLSTAIFKDKKSRRDFSFTEHTVALGGRDVRVIDPPFAILPREDNEGLIDSTGCIGASDIFTREVVIDDIPFDYAVPMLTGWELNYACEEDENVLRFGLWVHDVVFEQGPETGTLRFSVSSQLRDDDLLPSHQSRYNIGILGLKDGGPYNVIGPGGGFAPLLRRAAPIAP